MLQSFGIKSYVFNILSDSTPRRAPAYIVVATKAKYGGDIFVLGVAERELDDFWKGVTYHAVNSTRPVEKGRTVVDIDSKCHANNADRINSDGDEDLCHKGEEGSHTPEDWYDEFEITSKKEGSQTKSKSYRLQLCTPKAKKVGFTLDVKGSNFFNMAAPSAGITGSYTKTTQTTTEDSEGVSESLSQGYQVVDTLKVPPKTKVKALITTWAVTYESTTVTEATVDARATMSVLYRTSRSRKIGYGSILLNRGEITAKELFVNELDYKCEGDVVTFKRQGKVSYIGEEVEILKDKERLD